MVSFLKRRSVFLLCLAVVLCQSCTSNQPQIQTAAEQSKTAEQPAVQPAERSNIVAEIGDHVITTEDLEKRIIDKLRPSPVMTADLNQPVKPKDVLMEMITEKAMITEARNLNLLDNKDVQKKRNEFKNGLLLKLLAATYLTGKINITDSEIQEKMKANPGIDKAKAAVMLKREKTAKLTDEFYNDSKEKLHVRKLTENFPRAAQIHQKLLDEASVSDGIQFIKIKQIENLTQEEKNLVLVTFDGGEINLGDLFAALHEISPPTRPKNLSTPAGIDQFLEQRLMKKPILIAAAKFYGFEKNETLLKQLKLWDEKTLLEEIIGKTVYVPNEPNDKEVLAYFNKHRKDFATPKSLKIDQIWCQDYKTAKIVKDRLAAGKDFDSLKQEYSLDKKTVPVDVSANTEKMFFPDIWTGEPNTIIGPIKGLHQNRVTWRIVKILEKNQGRWQKYDEETMNSSIRYKMWEEQKEIILAAYKKQIIKKYPYRIYPEKIKNPLDIS